MVDLKKLRELVKLMVDNDIAEVDLQDEAEHIKLKRAGQDQPVVVAPAPPAPVAAPAPAAATAPAAVSAAATALEHRVRRKARGAARRLRQDGRAAGLRPADRRADGVA